MEFNVQNFMESLPIMGYGMLGIFIVTAIIVSCIYVMNWLTKGKK